MTGALVLRPAWREIVLAGATVLLTIDSFLPWYTQRWSTQHLATGRTTQHAVTASAWSSSTGWSIGVLLTVAAATGWLLCRRSPSLRRAAQVACLVAALAAPVVTAKAWLEIPSAAEAASGPLAFQPLPASGTYLGHVTRDALTARELNVSCGFYIGTALMIIVALCLASWLMPRPFLTPAHS
ncbi:hypothetical protein [Couchioplanes azureus]|uniref:hypothetical protein n=1 Tax=Couchioplanes caeruleus TaxID=56438 RepID=UPI00166F7A39|nr:hypothetical protein [Couchioplanes caeruleus]